jgi:hypothetical protein
MPAHSEIGPKSNGPENPRSWFNLIIMMRSSKIKKTKSFGDSDSALLLGSLGRSELTAKKAFARSTDRSADGRRRGERPIPKA